MREPDLATLAYVAGIIDGEGCIGIRKTKQAGSMKSTRYAGTLTIGSTSRVLIERVINAFGIGCVTHRFATRTKKGCFIWTIESRNARNVLSLVRPFLVVKRAQADLLIEFVDGFESFEGGRPGKFGGQRVSESELARRARTYSRMKLLNQVGPGTSGPTGRRDKKSRGITADFDLGRGRPHALFDSDRLDPVADPNRVDDLHP